MDLTQTKRPTLSLNKSIKTKEESTTQLQPVESVAITQTDNQQKETQKQPAKPYKFYPIYNKLHAKYPKVINLKAPVALGIGIHREISTEYNVTSQILKKWFMEYFRRCRYYKVHVAGANRYNLAGEITGVVTQEQEELKQQYIRNIIERKKERQQIQSGC